MAFLHLHYRILIQSVLLCGFAFIFLSMSSCGVGSGVCAVEGCDARPFGILSNCTVEGTTVTISGSNFIPGFTALVTTTDGLQIVCSNVQVLNSATMICSLPVSGYSCETVTFGYKQPDGTVVSAGGTSTANSLVSIEVYFRNCSTNSYALVSENNSHSAFCMSTGMAFGCDLHSVFSNCEGESQLEFDLIASYSDGTQANLSESANWTPTTNTTGGKSLIVRNTTPKGIVTANNPSELVESGEPASGYVQITYGASQFLRYITQ